MNFLTPAEVESLYLAVFLFPYMQGVRFLTDYLQGDTYYKIKHGKHNLERTLAQFELLKSMEENFDKMQQIVSTVAAENKKETE